MKYTKFVFIFLLIVQPVFTQDITNKLGASGNYDVTDSDSALLMRLQSDNGFLLNGTYGTGTIPIEDSGTRMMWFPKKAAFRAGFEDGVLWNEGFIGNYSTAMGNGTAAYGLVSTAMGFNTIANGERSTAMGASPMATGIASTAMGGSTKASGNASTAMGFGTEAISVETTAMGNETTASDRYSIAMGRESIASGWNSTAMGYNTTASGEASTAMGKETIASGYASTAMGLKGKASGEISTAMGKETIARGDYSTAIGDHIVAGGSHSVAIALNDQNGTNVTQANTMSVRGGKVGIGTVTPKAVLSIVGLSVYADNSAALAGGLLPGDLYRTATGVLRVTMALAP